MIRQIRGQVLAVEEGCVVVDVSGWGIQVHVTTSEPFTLEQEVRLMTHLAVKQDGPELYGFTDILELEFFEKLLSVSRVGPKTALSILRRAPREALERAIATRDIPYLTRVVGLGKKAAEKLAIELSEKMQKTDTPHDDEDGEVFDTLVALGYTEREARKALTRVPASVVGREARLKAALSDKTR